MDCFPEPGRCACASNFAMRWWSRKIDRWSPRYSLATVTWPATPLDPFFNASTMDDIAKGERLAVLDGG